MPFTYAGTLIDEYECYTVGKVIQSYRSAI